MPERADRTSKGFPSSFPLELGLAQDGGIVGARGDQRDDREQPETTTGSFDHDVFLTRMYSGGAALERLLRLGHALAGCLPALRDDPRLQDPRLISFDRKAALK